MLCSICVATGKKSTLRTAPAELVKLTSDRYWDEDGNEHVHTISPKNFKYVCSLGHETEPPGPPCPVCGEKWQTDAGKVFTKVAATALVVEEPPA